MAFVRSPGVAQAVVIAKWANLIDIVTVYHVSRSGELLGGEWTPQQLMDAGNRISGAHALFLDNVSNVYKVSEIKMRDLTNEIGSVASVPSAIAGSVSGQTTGPYEGAVIRWRTGLSGRTNGRTFIPGIEEAVVDNVGMLSADRIGAMATRAASFLTFLKDPTGALRPGAPLQLVIQSQKATAGPEASRPAWPVLSANCRPEIGIQRRRRISQ